MYVKTRQQEFDYPQGQNNDLTSYQGGGGIVLGGFLRRVILAIDRGDVGKLPFSDDVNSQSRLLMRRNIRERVAAVAPFLTFDHDPYMVVSDDGRLSWVMDAFTVSNNYPYSSHYNLGDNSVNYMRNSAKVVVDAYNGATTLYVFDSEGPILATYRRYLSPPELRLVVLALQDKLAYGTTFQAALRSLFGGAKYHQPRPHPKANPRQISTRSSLRLPKTSPITNA